MPDVELAKKKKKKTRSAKARTVSRELSQRPVAVSIVHVSTHSGSGNTADQDLERLLNAGVF